MTGLSCLSKAPSIMRLTIDRPIMWARHKKHAKVYNFLGKASVIRVNRQLHKVSTRLAHVGNVLFKGGCEIHHLIRFCQAVIRETWAGSSYVPAGFHDTTDPCLFNSVPKRKRAIFVKNQCAWKVLSHWKACLNMPSNIIMEIAKA